MSVDWKSLFRRYGGVSKEADIRISGYLIRPGLFDAGPHPVE